MKHKATESTLPFYVSEVSPAYWIGLERGLCMVPGGRGLMQRGIYLRSKLAGVVKTSVFYASEVAAREAFERMVETDVNTAAPNPYEHAGRLEKAIALYTFMHHHRVSAEQASKMDVPEWKKIAMLASVNPPSPKTRQRVIDMLRG